MPVVKHKATAFPSTHWSRLVNVASNSEAERRETLRWFARQYWNPVHHYLGTIRRGTPEDIEDLTQQFFTMLIERNDLASLSPEGGSLRGFLKVALRNFVASTTRAARARPSFVALDDVEGGTMGEAAPSPEDSFDRAWIHHVLMDAVAELKRQLEAEGRHDRFAIFDAYCLTDARDVTYEELGRRFEMKPEDARNRVREARRRMIEIVRGLTAEYLSPGEDLNKEVRFVLGA